MSRDRAVEPMRITTRLLDDGSSTFARVEAVEEDFRADRGGARGARVYRMWAIDELPLELPYDGSRAPVAGCNSPDETPEALRWSSPLPGEPNSVRASLLVFEPGYRAPLHWHETFDLQFMVSGSLVSTLDDGSRRELRPGDCMISHGANHGWEAGEDGAVLAVVRIAARREVPRQTMPGDRSHLEPETIQRLREAATKDPSVGEPNKRLLS